MARRAGDRRAPSRCPSRRAAPHRSRAPRRPWPPPPRSRPRRRAGPSVVRAIGARRWPACRDRPRDCRCSAPAAASPLRVRDSGRTRRDCPPRGSADCRAGARCALSPARGSRLVVSTGPVAEHPDVGGFDAFAHRHRARVGLVGNAAEAAGHHAPAVRRRGRIDAQHEGARHEPAVLPARRRRQPHDILADIIDAARGDVFGQARPIGFARVRPAIRLRWPAKPGTWSLNAPAIATSSSEASTRSRSARLAAPPGGDAGHDELVAHHASREVRQEGEQRARFEEAGARHVLDRDGARANGIDEAGHADAARRD